MEAKGADKHSFSPRPHLPLYRKAFWYAFPSGIIFAKNKFGLPSRPNLENALKRLIRYFNHAFAFLSLFASFLLSFSGKRKGKKTVLHLLPFLQLIRNGAGAAEGELFPDVHLMIHGGVVDGAAVDVRAVIFQQLGNHIGKAGKVRIEEG